MTLTKLEKVNSNKKRETKTHAFVLIHFVFKNRIFFLYLIKRQLISCIFEVLKIVSMALYLLLL